MRNRVGKVSLCLMALVCMVIGAACGTQKVEDGSTVMEIAGQDVVKEEYQLVLRSKVAEVKRGYTTEEANDEGFWTRKGEGQEGTPLQQIMELAREDLVHKKTVAKLAEQKGVAEGVDYGSIVGQMEKENDTREDSASSGGVVYGLASFTEEDYYTYVYTSMESQLIERLKREHPVSEEELEEIYQENIGEYTSDVRVKMLVGEMRVEAGMELAQQAAEDMAKGDEAKKQESLADAYPDINFYEIEMSSLNTEEGKSGAYAQRWMVASGMGEGEVCEPFQIGDHLMVMQCLSREEQAAEPLENIKGELESEVQTRLAKEDIEKEKQGAEVVCQQEVLEQVAREALEE